MVPPNPSDERDERPLACLLNARRDPAPDDNAPLLAAALARCGWRTALVKLDGLRLESGRVTASRADGSARLDLAQANLLWPLGFGAREGFLDRMQLLTLASQRTPCVNNPEALVMLHGKYPLAFAAGRFAHPDTWASDDPVWLRERVQALGGPCVLKPPAGSFGRDVFVVNPEDPNLDALLALLTGHGQGRYCLLQRWLPAVRAGENRVLVAGGRVIASYRRRPTRTASNLRRGNTVELAPLTDAQYALAGAIAADLMAHGVRFAGLDLAGEWLLEVNVANPGGLGTLGALCSADFAGDTAAAILAWHAAKGRG